MNKSMIKYVLGWILCIEAALMVLPAFVALIYGELCGMWFLAVIVTASCLGWLMSRKKPADTVFYLKEGCIATALGWITMSIFGALPFVLTGAIPSFTDALFETISGFTTTGASILADLDSLPRCCIFWRSLTHWIGGMGILVFLLAIVTMTGGSHMNLMKAESPGPSVGKLVPKVKHTAQILYFIYIGLTLLQIILMLIGGAPWFDAVTISLGTAGTGGFSVRNSGMADYSAYLQWVITIFMILFGVNFNAYYFILLKRWKQALAMEEVRWYFIIIFSAATIFMLDAYDRAMPFFDNLRHSFFTVGSIITTTGFATVDFDLWPQFSKAVLVLIMFFGACAGSTGGGIKVSRVLVAVRSIGVELYSYIHPKSVRKVRLDGKIVDDASVKAISTYFITFIVVFIVSLFIVSLDNNDFTTNFTAIAATLNNIGPGLGKVGPTQNFAFFSPLSKYVMMFDMLAGRLELFPMLLLGHPVIIKELISGKRKQTVK